MPMTLISISRAGSFMKLVFHFIAMMTEISLPERDIFFCLSHGSYIATDHSIPLTKGKHGPRVLQNEPIPHNSTKDKITPPTEFQTFLIRQPLTLDGSIYLVYKLSPIFSPSQRSVHIASLTKKVKSSGENSTAEVQG